MSEREEEFGDLLDRAWAAAIAKPRVTGRKGGGGGGSKRRRRWTELPRVSHVDMVVLGSVCLICRTVEL